METQGILSKIIKWEKESITIAYIYVLAGHLLMVAMWSLFKVMMNNDIDQN